jgi:hypothetical protein
LTQISAIKELLNFSLTFYLIKYPMEGQGLGDFGGLWICLAENGMNFVVALFVIPFLHF